MAANWKKVLFEGSKIDVRSISASTIPELTSDSPGVNSLPVLSYDDPEELSEGTQTGLFRTVAQNTLNTLTGNTLFTLSGSDHSNTSFNASADTLTFTTSNPAYLNAVLSDGGASNQVTIAFSASANYVTGSGQMNIISASSLTPTTALSDAIAFGPLGLGIGGQGAGTAPTALLNSLGGDYNTTIYPLLLRRDNNATTISDHTKKVDPDATSQQTDLPASAILVDQWRIFSNLWINKYSTSPQSTANVSQLDPDAPLVGRHSVYWLSASFLSGFPDGTPSLSASFSTITGSINTLSASVATLDTSASLLNASTGSVLVNANTSSLALIGKLTSKQVLDSELDQNVDQITFVDTDESGNNLNQGKRLVLGTEDTNGFFDLTIAGAFSASNYVLTGEGISFEQENVSTTFGGITYGTSSAHTHGYQGDTFITGSVDVTGDMHFGGSDGLGDHSGHDPAVLPSIHNDVNDGVPFQVLAADDDGNFGYVHLSGSAFAAVISGSADIVVEQITNDLAAITETMDSDSNEAAAIDDLEDGFTNNADSIENKFDSGIFFGTSSVEGNKIKPLQTASFSGTETTGTDVLTTSYVGDKIRYTLFPNRLANAALTDDDGIVYTSSLGIQNAAANIGTYFLRTEGILTASNTEDNITYIADLADDLADSPSGTHFLTGSGDFSDVLNFPGVNSFDTPTPQGVVEFSLEGVYKFGATASKLSTDGNPTFTDLTIDDGGTLTVTDTLVTVNTTNLTTKDQYILINEGAAVDGGVSSGHDKDGGIIVDHGGGSGSLFYFDYIEKSWGFLGSNPTSETSVNFDYKSFDTSQTNHEALARVIFHSESANPPAIADIKYGTDNTDSQLGIMYVDTTANADNVFIYA